MNTRLLALPIAAALALAGCATSSPGYYGGSGQGYGANCMDCGTVTAIETGAGSRAPNATGAIVGGVIGGVAAREVAKNQTDSEGRRNTATVAGAAAGAAIGNAIQNRAGTGYNVYVRMSDGRQIVTMQDDVGRLQIGSPVRVVNGRAYPL